MRSTLALTPTLVSLLLLSSCSSPPKPPTVDESRKRPVNSLMAVELLVCRNDLQNTRLLATESGRLAESTAATLASIAARQQMLAAAAATPKPIQANAVYVVRFDFGSAQVVMPSDTASALIDEAKAAPLVLLRGRTDGTIDTLAESRIARDRSAAVREYLVAAGVEPARIRSTYQPSGDHVADNGVSTGRGLNRRVEIEIYRALPVAHGTPSTQS